MKLVAALVVASVLWSCSKSEERTPPATAAPPRTRLDRTKLPPAPPDADYIHVSASHAQPKPTDPDVFDLRRFRVVHADFDPMKIEGGTADLELDLTSLVSDSAERDDDVKRDYLETDRFGTATIHVDHVRKTGAGTYGADATVSAHGLEKTFPVEFTLLATGADSIRIFGTHTFQRLDFGIGAPLGEDDAIGMDITIELQLTLKRT